MHAEERTLTSPNAAQALAPQDPRRSRYRGCLLGLCIGDAFGAAAEFLTRAEILAAYPPSGISDLLPRPGFPAGSYTDDGQMSVATARGVLDWRRISSWTPGAALDTAAQEALSTAIFIRYMSWAASDEHVGRGPGTATMTALEGRKPGRPGDRVNRHSKGCGGVMRVAPIGLAGLGEAAFEAGARAAILTHGHPTSDASSGFLALLITHLVGGLPLSAATARARRYLTDWSREDIAAPKGVAETLEAVDAAVVLAAEGGEPYAAIGQIGQVGEETPDGDGKGWVAEEDLGIGLYAALRFPNDFAAAVQAAANISGDSDSTASVAGAILGAALGVEGIPPDWVEQVENRELLVELADGLCWDAGPAGTPWLGHLAAAGDLYAAKTTYNMFLAEFRKSTGDDPDLTRHEHRRALLLLINQLKARVPNTELLHERLHDWFELQVAQLPSHGQRLVDATEEQLCCAAHAYLDLMEGDEQDSVSIPRFTAVAVAKCLFAIRPAFFAPWDRPMIRSFGRGNSGGAYESFLRAMQTDLRSAQTQCAWLGIELNDLQAVLGRPSLSALQLVNEWHWWRITRRHEFSG
jgi:ADP-ribosylglycohydrolase